MQNNYPPISSTLLECIIYDILDDAEYLLDSLNIDHPNSDHQDEIEELANTIISKYKNLDLELDYCDLENEIVELHTIIRYENDKYYRIYFTEGKQGYIEIDDMEEVEPYQETITKYRTKCQESTSSIE